MKSLLLSSLYLSNDGESDISVQRMKPEVTEKYRDNWLVAANGVVREELPFLVPGMQLGQSHLLCQERRPTSLPLPLFISLYPLLPSPLRMSPPEDDDGHSFDGVAAEARFDDADQENSTESKYGVSRNLVPLKVVMTVSFALVMVVCSTCCIVVTMNFFSQSATARNTELGTAVATRTATGINHNLNLPLTKLESWMQIWRYEHERNGVVYTSTSTLTNDDVLYWEEMVLDSFAWGRSHAVISHVGLCTASGAYLHATQDTALSTTTIRLSRPPLEDTEVMYDGALQKQYEYSPAGNYSCRDAVFFQDVLASLTSPLFEPTMVQIKPGPEKDGQHVQYTTAMVVPGAKGMEVLAVAYMAYDVAVIPAFVERIAKSTEGLVISVVHADRTLLAVSASPGEALEGTAEEMCCHVLSGTRVTAPVPLAMLNINVCVNILSDGKKDMDEVLEVALLASCGVFAAFVAFCFVFSHVLFLPLKDVRNRLLAIARIEIPSPARGSMFVEVNALQVCFWGVFFCLKIKIPNRVRVTPSRSMSSS